MDFLPLILLAYIGPGAGIALAASFFAVLIATVSAMVSILVWPVRRVWRVLRGQIALKRACVKRVVILGLDGLEPTLVEKYLDAGLLPNLAALRSSGSYGRLGTTCPPLSPVAWSSFSTGTNPGKHNIFDFIARRRSDYRPEVSSVSIQPPKRTLRLGNYVIPLSRPRIVGQRKSRPFWDVLGRHGVFSAVIRVPITFPPDRFHGVQLSAMCVPDLLGSQGTYFQFCESDSEQRTQEGDVSDIVGQDIQVHRRGQRICSELVGPENPFRFDRQPLRASLEIVPQGNGSATLRLGGQRVTLKRNEWSPWISVPFRAVPGITIHGICRFLLNRLEAPFSMYCSPIQIDPVRPVMPISHPQTYSIYLGRLLGPFATMGLAEDTEGLSQGALDEEQFLVHVYDVHREREGMLMDALDRVTRGVVVCVFDAPDRLQHMFWRFLEDGHSALSDLPNDNGNAIRQMYQKMDQLVGRIVNRVDRDTAVIVMSDHGFKPFRRCVDLNAWLLDNGYLRLNNGATHSDRPYLADVDWNQTRAYAIGLAGMYVNERGREAKGIVASGEPKQALLAELRTKLLNMRDDEHDQSVVYDAILPTSAYDGPYIDNAPDLIVGYHEGYRVSWGASVGKCSDCILFDNTKAWSGDHCIHPALVPGVLFCSLELNLDGAQIIDLAPTTLDLMGVEIPSYMDGRSLLCSDENS